MTCRPFNNSFYLVNPKNLLDSQRSSGQIDLNVATNDRSAGNIFSQNTAHQQSFDNRVIEESALASPAIILGYFPRITTTALTSTFNRLASQRNKTNCCFFYYFKADPFSNTRGK